MASPTDRSLHAAHRALDELRPDRARAEPAEGRDAYGGVITRTIAIVIDALLIDVAAIIVTGAWLLLKSLLGPAGHHYKLDALVASILFGIWVIVYFGTFWITTGQTPGNRVMHIRVDRLDGTRMKPRHVIIRLAAMLVSVPLFWGYLPILWTPRRRGLPDALARTVVVVVPDSVARPLLARSPGAAGSAQRDGAGDGGSATRRRVDRDRAVNGGEPVVEVAEPGPGRGGGGVEPGPVVADLEVQPPPRLPD
jgi:uncharacterized RDD family membrane protein YckC